MAGECVTQEIYFNHKLKATPAEVSDLVFAHRNTPQHTATHRNTPQHTAAHRNTPQHTAHTNSKQLLKKKSNVIYADVYCTYEDT